MCLCRDAHGQATRLLPPHERSDKHDVPGQLVTVGYRVIFPQVPPYYGRPEVPGCYNVIPYG